MTASQTLCPCDSKLEFNACCSPILAGKKRAETAEQLLRARYTAFTRGNVDFILDTHHSKTKKDVNREEIQEWSQGSEWLGFKIVQAEGGGEQDEKATFVFCAQYKDKSKDKGKTDEEEGKPHDHWEQSFFEKEGGEWRFLDAKGVQIGTYRRPEPKIGRNDPCPCGSGQKFKKCCARGS